MQSKGFIKLIAVLLGLACVYQLSFTFKTRGVEKKAAAYAAQFPLDQQAEAEQHYLDSVQNLSVYNLGFRKFTYKECKEKELNLGLDLKGGMNVMLEVQVEDVIKALAGDSQNDPAFVQAIAEANEAMKQGTSNDYIADFVKAYSRLSNGRAIAEIFVSPDRKDITLESSDADVEKILKKETEAAINASFNVLRSRIDHFGVTQPNIMRLPNSHRILVELPGVKEPQRVRDCCRAPLRWNSGPPTMPTRCCRRWLQPTSSSKPNWSRLPSLRSPRPLPPRLRPLPGLPLPRPAT